MSSILILAILIPSCTWAMDWTRWSANGASNLVNYVVGGSQSSPTSPTSLPVSSGAVNQLQEQNNNNNNATAMHLLSTPILVVDEAQIEETHTQIENAFLNEVDTKNVLHPCYCNFYSQVSCYTNDILAYKDASSAVEHLSQLCQDLDTTYATLKEDYSLTHKSKLSTFAHLCFKKLLWLITPSDASTRAIFAILIKWSNFMPANIGIESVIAGRESQEDRATFVVKDKYHYLAVFDGHTADKKIGPYTADHARKELYKEITAQPNFESTLLRGELEAIKPLLVNGFTSFQQKLVANIKNGTSIIGRDEGTTAVVVFLVAAAQPFLITAHVGDSEAYCLQDKELISLTPPHNLKNSTEKERFGKTESALIINNRVAGALAITRALGDTQFAQYGVIAEPMVNKLLLTSKHSWLLMGSDGVYTSPGINPQLLAKVLSDNQDKLAGEMVGKLFERLEVVRGDNKTAIVVKLDSYVHQR